MSSSAHHQGQHALHSHPGATAVPMATGTGRGRAGPEGKQNPSSLELLLPRASSGTDSPTQLLLLLATFSAMLSLLPVFICSLERVPGCLSLPQHRQLWQLSPPQARGQRHSSASDLHTPTAPTVQAQLQQRESRALPEEWQNCKAAQNISPQPSGEIKARGWWFLGAPVLPGQREGRELLRAQPWTLLCFPASPSISSNSSFCQP